MRKETLTKVQEVQSPIQGKSKEDINQTEKKLKTKGNVKSNMGK